MGADPKAKVAAALSAFLSRLPAGVHRLLPYEQRLDLRHLLGRYRPSELGADLRAPDPRSGERTGPPDFVGVGVELADSRWWYRLIADHPGVTSRDDVPVARHYLAHFLTRGFGPAEVDGYHRLFPRPAGLITGEWTPGYLAFPWVPPLLARAAPGARVLVIVRDPVERLLAGLVHSADRRRAQVGTAVSDAVDRGFYGAQLERLYAFVPPGRVLVLQHEKVVADPAAHLAATYRFLGLDDNHVPAGLVPPRSRRRRPGLDPVTDARLVDLYAPDVDVLASLVPDLDLSLWPGMDGPGTGRRAPTAAGGPASRVRGPDRAGTRGTHDSE